MATADQQDLIKEPAKEPQTPKVSQYESQFGLWNTETATDKPWKIMLYGAAGSGKTFMAGTFPDPIFLDLEDGMRSVLPLQRKILRFPKDPSVPVTDIKQVKQFYDAVKKIPVGQSPFKTIVIDSLNELQVLLMRAIMTDHPANRLYDDQPTQGDYGKLAREMSNIVRDFIQLPYNLIMTAAATDRQYDTDKVYPLFIGQKTGPDLRRITEQIGYCFTAQRSKDSAVDHLVAFGDCPSYSAKDRTPKLSKPMTNTYSTMMKVLASTKGTDQ